MFEENEGTAFREFIDSLSRGPEQTASDIEAGESAAKLASTVHNALQEYVASGASTKERGERAIEAYKAIRGCK